ncbi:MAG: ABC transporter substrate-binding protein [Phormidesmis sp. RL_2_1]|nr:ABC transporter substrate-binding protein [Phormidesmis sp. RL_2_1]
MTNRFYKIRRRHALQLLAGASGAAFLHACNTASDTPETSDSADSAPAEEATTANMSMTLGSIPWAGQVPMYIAQDKGFYEEEGLDFDLRLFGAGNEYIAAFLSDQLDGVAPVTSEAVLIKSQGKDYRIVMVQDNSVGIDGILAKNSITSIEDFKGKKVAVETSAVGYFFLLQVLKEAGLSKDDITAVNTDPAAAAAAFQSGNVDIAVTYAPFLQEAADATEDGRIIYDSSQMPTAISDLYIFDTAYVEENPEAVQAFVNATLRGIEYLKENPEEGLEIGAAVLEMEAADLESDLAGLELPDQAENLEMLADPDSDRYLGKPLAELSAFLLSEEQIEADPGDLSALIDPQFVEAAKL